MIALELFAIFGVGFIFGVMVFVVWSWGELFKQYEQYANYNEQITALKAENTALRTRAAMTQLPRRPIEKGDES